MITVTFGEVEGSQDIFFVPTDLYKLYVETEAKWNAAVEGPNSDKYYELGQYAENSKADLKKALDNALAVLNTPGANQGAAESALETAAKAFEAKKITADNSIEIRSVSGETGETLDSKFLYGPEGYSLTEPVEVIANYKPFIDPDEKGSDANKETEFINVTVTFTKDTKQVVYVMYREDPTSPVGDKSNWKETAQNNILKYATDNEIEWTEGSRYDSYDVENGKTTSTGKEYSDFLNILKNAVPQEKDRISEDYVRDYLDDLFGDEFVYKKETIEEDLIAMIVRYYRDISESFYTDDPISGDNERLDTDKAVYYEDLIDTSIVFKIKEEDVRNPKFFFKLVGNKYLTFAPPNVELYKLSEGQDPAVDPSVLNRGDHRSAKSIIEEFNEDNVSGEVLSDGTKLEYGYKITVEPQEATYNKNDYFYVRVDTKITVNEESEFFEGKEAVQNANTISEKRRAAVNELVKMYKVGVNEGYFIEEKDRTGQMIPVTDIDSDDLLFALQVIRDLTETGGGELITKGLTITTNAQYQVLNDDGSLSPAIDLGERDEELLFKAGEVPVYPDFVE